MRQRRAFFESLEDRLVLANIMVTSLADNLIAGDGDVTLREAIVAHNRGGTGGNSDFDASLSGEFGDDNILFDPAVFAAKESIFLDPALGSLPLSQGLGSISITGPEAGVIIDGNFTSRIVTVDLNVSATLSGLTMANGRTVFDDGQTAFDDDFGFYSGRGAGLVNRGRLTIDNCTFSGNYAESDGGGIYNDWQYGPADLTISNSTFSANVADSGGGGISSGGSVTISNSTFTGNSTSSSGGAIKIDAFEGFTPQLTISNSTISGNYAGFGGGGISIEVEASLSGSIVAGNSVDDISTVFGSSSVSGSHNLIGTDHTGGLVDGVDGNQVGVSIDDVRLDILADNGGPTQTMAILPGSFAIGQGVTANSATFDQRGVARPIGTPGDVGAYQRISNAAPTGSVYITGIPRQGEKLTATNSLADADGLGEISYQWQADGTNIDGAVQSTYVLRQAEVGSVIRVLARYTDGQGNAESVASAATDVVADDAPLTAISFLPPTATAGVAFGPATVFNFSDANLAAAAADYVATVAPGDGNTFTNTTDPDVVQVVADGSGGFNVQLTYTYAAALIGGTFSVQVSGPGGGAISASTANSFSGTITSLASLPPGSPVVYVPSSLVQDASGNLYGTTVNGGDFNHGMIFKVAAGSGEITTLASFEGANGSHPYGAPVIDSQGNLYGTTNEGGAHGYDNGGLGYGTVWKLAAGASTITTLISFDFSNGAYPESALIIDGSDRLFGTTVGGGPQGFGTVFEVAAGSNQLTTLAFLNGTDGGFPEGRLIMDGSGNLFGTTQSFGQGPGLGYGTVFQVPHLGGGAYGALTTLASFDGSDPYNPSHPQTSLVVDGSGNLFGTTFNGGAFGMGVVYKVAAGSGVVTTLASLSASSQAGLVMDGDGNLFGTTVSGGEFGLGSVYELARGSNVITTVASLDYTKTGAQPASDLFMDSSGALYGTALFGGESGVGTVYKVELTPTLFSVTGAHAAAVRANEGSSVTNTGTFTDLHGSSTLTASVGTVTPGGVNGTWSWSLPVDDGPAAPTSVTITVDDGMAAPVTTTFTYTVDSVDPTATFSSNGSITYGQTATVSFSNQQDPSTADTTAGFHYAYSETGDFSGITYASGSSPSATHEYIGLSVGAYTFYARIIDKDDGFTQYSTVVTVSPASLTVTATNASKTYGQSDPPLTYTYTGLVNGDVAANFTGALGRDSGQNVGSYAIGQNTLAAIGNYTIGSFTNGTLTINKAPLTIVVDNQSKTYGQPDPPLTFTYTGLVNGDLAADFTGALGRIANENVNEYVIGWYSLRTSGNYRIGEFQPGKLKINPAPLTVVADNQVKTYGQVDPPLTYSYTGLVRGDVTARFTGSLARVAGQNVGDYAIHQNTFAAIGNYTISAFQAGKLTVNKAPLTVVVDNKSKTYGQPDPPLTFTYTGLVNGDVAATFTGALGRISNENVNKYEIGWYSLRTSGNYYIGDFRPGTLTITPAPLAVVAHNQTRIYGRADPALSYSYTGLVNNDNAAVFTGGLGRVTGQNVGQYEIHQGTLAATGNYIIGSYKKGLFTVTRAPLKVTADNQSKTYGQPDAPLTFSYTGLVNGDQDAPFTGALGRIDDENVGVYTIGWYSLRTSGNYYINEFRTGTLTINPAPLTVKASNTSKYQGQSNPPLTYTYTGLVNSEDGASFTGALSRDAGETAGTYVIRQGSLQATGNYTIRSFIPATFTIGLMSSISVGELQFTISSAGSAFTSRNDSSVGTIYSFSSPDDAVVQVGFVPTSGSTFQPLMTMAGDFSVIPSRMTFQSTGQVSTVIAGAHVPLLTNIHVPSISDLVSTGVSGFAYPQSISFKPDYLGGAFRLDSLAFSRQHGLQLKGSISPLPGLNIAVNGTNSLNISSSGDVSLTGVSAVPSGSFTVGGVKFDASALRSRYATVNKSFELYGNARTTVAGLTNLTVTLGPPTNPGLVVTNGALSKLDATIDGSFKVDGLTITSKGLDFKYSSGKFTLEGTADINIGKVGNVAIAFGFSGADGVYHPGLIIEKGQLIRLDMAVGSQFAVSNLVFKAGNDLRLTWDRAKTIHNPSTSNRFNLTGSAGFDLNVQVKRVTFIATFGREVTDPKTGVTTSHPGLIISNGSLVRLDMSVDFELSFTQQPKTVTFPPQKAKSVTVTGKDLRFTWDRARTEYNTGDRDRFSLSGTAGVEFPDIKGDRTIRDGKQGFFVTFGYTDPSGTIHPGLVIEGSSLKRLDMRIDGRVTVYELIQLEAQNVTFTWDDANTTYNPTPHAVFTIPEGRDGASRIEASIPLLKKAGLDHRAFIQFGGTDKFGNRRKGLVISGDTLTSLYMSANWSAAFPGRTVTNEGSVLLDYNSESADVDRRGTLFIEGVTNLKVLSFFNANARFEVALDVTSEPGLRHLTFEINTPLTIGGATLANTSLSMSYVASTRTLTMTGSAKIDLGLGSLEVRLGGVPDVRNPDGTLSPGVPTRGLVIANGQLVNLDMTVESGLDIGILKFDGRLQMQYEAAGTNSRSFYTAKGFQSVARAYGLAIDSHGHLWLSDPSSGTVTQYRGETKLFGLFPIDNRTTWNIRNSGPIAFDANDHLYVANGADIHKVTFQGNTLSNVRYQFTMPLDVAGFAVDGTGRLFIDSDGAFYASNRDPSAGNAGPVVKVNPDWTLSSFLTSSGNLAPQSGMVVDSLGNLFVANPSLGTISKVTRANVISTIAAGLDRPSAMSIDEAGNLVVAASETVITLTPTGEVVSRIGINTGRATALSFYSGTLVLAGPTGPVRLVSPYTVSNPDTWSISGTARGQFNLVVATGTVSADFNSVVFTRTNTGLYKLSSFDIRIHGEAQILFVKASVNLHGSLKESSFYFTGTAEVSLTSDPVGILDFFGVSGSLKVGSVAFDVSYIQNNNADSYAGFSTSIVGLDVGVRVYFDGRVDTGLGSGLFGQFTKFAFDTSKPFLKSGKALAASAVALSRGDIQGALSGVGTMTFDRLSESYARLGNTASDVADALLEGRIDQAITAIALSFPGVGLAIKAVELLAGPTSAILSSVASHVTSVGFSRLSLPPLLRSDDKATMFKDRYNRIELRVGADYWSEAEAPGILLIGDLPRGVTLTPAGKFLWLLEGVPASGTEGVYSFELYVTQTFSGYNGARREKFRFTLTVADRPDDSVSFGPVEKSRVYYDDSYTLALSSERSSLTHADGSFVSPVPVGSGSGQLVSVGGNDLSTGLSVKILLTAPYDASALTPLSTLVHDVMLQFPTLGREQANAVVGSALGIPANLDLLQQHPLHQALMGDPESAQAFAAEVKVTSLVSLISQLLSGLPGAPSSLSLSTHVLASLASIIGDMGGAPLDLADPAIVEIVIEETMSSANFVPIAVQIPDGELLAVDPRIVPGASQVLRAIPLVLDPSVRSAAAIVMAAISESIDSFAGQINSLPRPVGVSGASNDSPIVITSPAHGLATGAQVLIHGVTGNTAANGSWTVAVLDSDRFSLGGSNGEILDGSGPSGNVNGAYTGGGVWNSNTGTVTGIINDSPIVVSTKSTAGLRTGQKVTIAGVVGNGAANGTWPITVLDDTTFSLLGSDGIGSAGYSNGGSWNRITPYLDDVVRAQVVAQATIAPQLPLLSPASLASFVSAHTGANLSHQIAAAMTGDLDPPVLAVNSIVQQAVGAGNPVTFEFIVTPIVNAPANLPFSVSYVTTDGTATAEAGDYVPVNGTLSWAAGDYSPRTVAVPVNVSANLTPYKLFAVEFSNPTHATMPFRTAIGIIDATDVPTTTTLTASNLKPTTVEPVTFTATVDFQDDLGDPGFGEFAFYDGSERLGTASLVDGVATFTTTLQAGSRDVTAIYLGADLPGVRYVHSSAAVTPTVSPASQSITFEPLEDQVYGAPTFALDATASSGFPVSYRLVSGPATISDNWVTVTGVGTVVIEAWQSGDFNHAPAPAVQQSFQVTPAPLTFTVDSQSMIYGGSLPTLSGTFSGFALGDSLDDFAVEITFFTPPAGSSVGSYCITATVEDLSNQLANYTLSVVEGILTVTQADLYVSVDDTSKTYGETATHDGTILSGTNSDLFDSAGITATFASEGDAATAPVGDGFYPITVTLSDPYHKLRNYTVHPTSATLTVTKAPQSITWSDPLPIVYGTPLSEAQLNAVVEGVTGGSAPGFLTYSPPAGTMLLAGTHTLSVTAAETPDYQAATHSVPLVVVDLFVDAGVDQTAREGSPVQFHGSFRGSASSGTQSIVWEFGDGNSATGTLTPTHVYADNGTYTVRLTVADPLGGSVTDTLEVSVANVAPAVTLLTNSSPECRPGPHTTTVTVSGGFRDDGRADTHTVRVDWGDGTWGLAAVSQANGSGSFTASRTYATGGVFEIVVTVTDDDRDSIVALTTAAVAGVRVTPDKVLQVVGTEGRDHIDVKLNKNPKGDTIEVKAKLNQGSGGGKIDGDFEFPATAVTSIWVVACQGNDHVHVHDKVTAPAKIDGGSGDDQIKTPGGGNNTLFGGEGNDQLHAGHGNNFVDAGDGDDQIHVGNGRNTLRGGNGDDKIEAGNGQNLLDGGAGDDELKVGAGSNILLGGAGIDRLLGGGGRDLLVGGLGADHLDGNGDDDLLVAGRTAYDEDYGSLEKILAEWISGADYATRVARLRGTSSGGLNGSHLLQSSTILDDGAVDVLVGSGGLDWFLTGLQDRIKDRKSNEFEN